MTEPIKELASLWKMYLEESADERMIRNRTGSIDYFKPDLAGFMEWLVKQNET